MDLWGKDSKKHAATMGGTKAPDIKRFNYFEIGIKSIKSKIICL